MAIKTRNYFKGKKVPTYKDDQLHFIDSVTYKNDTNDNASTTQSGLVRTVSDANAILRLDPANYIGILQPHQQSTNISSVTGDHVLINDGVPISGGLTLKRYNYDGGKRYDYMWVIVPGSPGGGTQLNCLGVDDINGLWLNASSTIFETSGDNLSVKDNGIGLVKLEALTANKATVTDASGQITTSVTTDTQLAGIGSIGNSKIVVTTAGGIVSGSSVVTLSELEYLGSVTAGTSAASKAVVLSAASKIDTIDITSLKINGTTVSATATQLDYTVVTPGTRTINKAVVVDGSGKINALDITALTLNGTAITSVANDINLLSGKAGAGLLAADLALLVNASAIVSASDIQAVAGFSGVVSVSGDNLTVASGKFLKMNGVLREPVEAKVTGANVLSTNKLMYVDLSGGDVTLNLPDVTVTNIGESYEFWIVNNATAKNDFTLDCIDAAESIYYGGSDSNTITISSVPIGARIMAFVISATQWACVYHRPVVCISGTDDPSAVAKVGELGDTYFKTDTDKLYVKKDSGSSTNWYLLN